MSAFSSNFETTKSVIGNPNYDKYTKVPQMTPPEEANGYNGIYVIRLGHHSERIKAYVINDLSGFAVGLETHGLPLEGISTK